MPEPWTNASRVISRRRVRSCSTAD
jgi:hypothetical protein